MPSNAVPDISVMSTECQFLLYATFSINAVLVILYSCLDSKENEWNFVG